jgi:hypothetical protein
MKKYMRALFTSSCIIVFLSILAACNPSPKTTTSSTPLPTGPQTLPIIDTTNPTLYPGGSISITAETNLNYTFNVAANMQDVSVTGYFTCTGGAPDLIEVYLMDNSTYAKWVKNPGGQSTILYDSEEMSAGALNEANLIPGIYHLIFSNKASADLSAAQAVVTKIDLNWTYAQ